ncbi:beta-Ala-His dipeptidase [Eubacterium sp.]|uniref:beta-Ala-His dipeptidase n=1 Tax=Eubacterium sp. TaxID=142586 RepID=UPI002FC99958
MEKILAGLTPKDVFEQFEAICGIPHGSYHTHAIADYCEAYAKAKGLSYLRDSANNLIITVPASPGYEDSAPVIFQGHMDMVCEKTPDSTFDFDIDGLKLVVEDGYIHATDTTLGGDDGIAIAMGLALMADSSIPHPKLYLVFTTDEEVGMGGATALDLSPIADATSMINMDSEEEGIFITGCAGGAFALCSYPLRRTKAKGLCTTIKVSGLAGGHSGTAIQYFGTNANVLLGQILFQLSKTLDYSIIRLNGGSKDNAIPREAQADILIGPNEKALITEKIAELAATFTRITGSIDRQLSITAEFGDIREYEVFGRDSEELAIFVLMNSPNGVMSMNHIQKGLVDTSLNLGIMRTDGDCLSLSFAVRSNQTASREFLTDRLCAFTRYLGGTASVSGVYPPWEYRTDSPLRDLAVAKYTEIYGKPPVVETIHAGLECGIIASKLPDLDILAMGPNILDIHTTEERMEIASVQRTWKFLLAMLKSLK